MCDCYFCIGKSRVPEVGCCPNCNKAVATDLQLQVDMLATVLMAEFGGPDRSEGAIEMAIRLLREQKTELDADRMRLPDLDYRGRIANRSYELAWDFDGGVRCERCSRLIPEGTPYVGVPDSVREDGLPVTLVICVYCEEK